MSTIALRSCQHVLQFDDADMSSSRFKEVRLAESTFEHVSLERASFSKVTFAGARFHGVQMEGSELEGANLKDVAIRNGKYEARSRPRAWVIELQTMEASLRRSAGACS